MLVVSILFLVPLLVFVTYSDDSPMGSVVGVDGLTALAIGSILTSVVSFVGFVSTTVLAWRRDLRNARDHEREMMKKDLEIEKLRRELSPKKKKA